MDSDVNKTMPDFQVKDFNPPNASVKILNIEYITDTILDAVSPVDILYFSLTCRLARQIAVRYRSFVFNINRRLRRFFRNPLAFRSLQAQTKTLISGSFALQFFDRSHYVKSDLDLYTHPGFSRSVGEWLINEGYGFSAGPTQDVSFDVAEKSNWRGTRAPYGAQESSEWSEYQWNGVWEVYSFQKTEDGKSVNVQIIASSISPLETILNFHSSEWLTPTFICRINTNFTFLAIVHNFISHSHAYSLYPNATFIQRQGLCLERATERYEEALAKYRARGWDIRESALDYETDFFLDAHRWVDDRMSWVISLDMDGIDVPTLLSGVPFSSLDDPVTVNSFRMTFKPTTQREPQAQMVMNYEVLVHPLLRYQYLIADEAFLKFFKSVLDRLWSEFQVKLTVLPADMQERFWLW